MEAKTGVQAAGDTATGTTTAEVWMFCPICLGLTLVFASGVLFWCFVTHKRKRNRCWDVGWTGLQVCAVLSGLHWTTNALPAQYRAFLGSPWFSKLKSAFHNLVCLFTWPEHGSASLLYFRPVRWRRLRRLRRLQLEATVVRRRRWWWRRLRRRRLRRQLWRRRIRRLQCKWRNLKKANCGTCV